jgi:hypothetical protein
MTRPTLFEDVERIVEAMRSGGQKAANDLFQQIVKDRKLIAWEIPVLKEKAQLAMCEAGLWQPAPKPAVPAPQPEGDTVPVDQSPVKENA